MERDAINRVPFPFLPAAAADSIRDAAPVPPQIRLAVPAGVGETGRAQAARTSEMTL